MDKCLLSIVIVTMNRARQLKDAILSVFNSVLPELTEFVIIDNASVDDTCDVVHKLFEGKQYGLTYIRNEQNLGVGGGRNLGFETAKGTFVYFLDDDAVIDEGSYQEFFVAPLKLFASNPKIASITTQIYDEMLKRERTLRFSRINDTAYPNICMYLGGSHFLRASSFECPLYLDIMYGKEELIPSLYALDKGYSHCFMPNVKIVHKPLVNKWIPHSKSLNEIMSIDIGITFASKCLIYKWYFAPVLFVFFVLRCLKYFDFKLGYYKRSFYFFSRHVKGVRKHKIRNSTVFYIMRNFGMGSAF